MNEKKGRLYHLHLRLDVGDYKPHEEGVTLDGYSEASFRPTGFHVPLVLQHLELVRVTVGKNRHLWPQNRGDRPIPFYALMGVEFDMGEVIVGERLRVVVAGVDEGVDLFVTVLGRRLDG